MEGGLSPPFLIWGIMKKFCIVFFVIIIFSISVFAYLTLTKPKVIKIGFVASLSGRNSQLGVNGRNALLVAAEEINLRGGLLGHQIKLLIKDNQGKPQQIAALFEQFAEGEVPVVVGPYTSNMAKQLLLAIRNKDILVISPTISTDKVSGQDDNFIRLIESAANQGQILAQRIHDDGYQRIAIVYDHSNADYTKTVLERMKSALNGAGLEIVYISDMPLINEKVDFIKIAEEISSSGADSLAIVSNSIDAASLAQQVRKQGSTIQMYGSRWAKSGHIIDDGGKAVEGMILVSNYSEKRKSDKFMSFVKNYKQRFGEEPNFPQFYTYDAMYLLKQAVEEANSLESDDIKKAILYISRFQGLDAVVEIDKYGDAWRPYAMVKIENGEFKDID